MCCSLRKSGTYLLFITVIFFAGNGSAVAQVDHLVRGSAVKINGFVGEKLANAAANRVFAQDVNRLIEPFRHRDEARCWQTEFWGKWFTSAVLAYRYQPNPASSGEMEASISCPYSAIAHSIRRVLRAPSPAGLIPNSLPASSSSRRR